MVYNENQTVKEENMRKGSILKFVCIIAAFVFLVNSYPAMADSYAGPLPDKEDARVLTYGSSVEVTPDSDTLKFVPQISGIYCFDIVDDIYPNWRNAVAIFEGDTLIMSDEDCNVRLTEGKTYYIVAYQRYDNGNFDFSVRVTWGCLPVVGAGSNRITYDSGDASFTLDIGSRHELSVEITPELCSSPSYEWHANGELLGTQSSYITPYSKEKNFPLTCYVTSGDIIHSVNFFGYFTDGFELHTPLTEDILIDSGSSIRREIEYTYDMPEELAADEISYHCSNHFASAGTGSVRSTPVFSVTPSEDDHVLYRFDIYRDYGEHSLSTTIRYYVFQLPASMRTLFLDQEVSINVRSYEDLDRRIYVFTPETSGYYKLQTYAYSSGTPHIAIFDSDYNFIGRCGVDRNGQVFDRDPEECNFAYEAYLEAGQMYYFAQAICAESETERYSFKLTYSPVPTMTNTDPFADETQVLPEDIEGADLPDQPSVDPGTGNNDGPSTNTDPNTGSNSGTGNSGSGSGSSAVTPTPAIPTSAPSSQASSEPGVSGFVERLYSVALGRTSDPSGKQDWIDAITMRGETGASAARGFLYSPEFLNKECTNEEFVAVLYRTFFDREPDQDGFNAWVGVLNNGTSKEEVIEGFINSTEWANLCLRYGIRSGGTGTPNIEVEPNQATIDFATRLYTTCLSRNADQNGLMAWARQLANQRDTGTGAARGFFFSSEFTGQNVSNEEYVNRLYRTFMGREADEAGFTAWVAQLNEGVSREEVFDGFAGSQEFARICARYGIIR